MTTPDLVALRIQAKNNFLNGLTLYETVDMQTLLKLIHSDLLKEQFNNKICSKWHSGEKQQLQKYLQTVTEGRAKITYNKSANNPYGRCNPQGGIGLYNIRREIRHTLASEFYEDVDIVNAHPLLLLQSLKRAGLEAPCLESYVTDRNEWLDMVAKHYKIADLPAVQEQPHLIKDIPKNLFIRLLFSGGPARWIKDYNVQVQLNHPKITEFQAEIHRINELISHANPDLLELAKKNKPDSNNHEGTACSYFLQECEVQILETIYNYCVKNEYIKNDNAVLCADGIMIEKSLYKPELLSALEVEVQNKLGFAVKFSNKKMELGYNKVLDKHLKFDIDTYSTSEVANIFKILYMDKFLFNNSNLYAYNGTYWERCNDKRYTAIHDQVLGPFLKYMERIAFDAIKKHMESPTRDDAYSARMEKLNDFLGAIVNNLRDNKKRKFLIDDIIYSITCEYIKMDADPFLIGFKNGVYDLQTGTWTKPHYKQYISMTTGWSFSHAKADRTNINKLLEQIFPNKNVRELALMIFSTALWGKSIERFVVFTGRGGNGKGVLDELMMHCVGDYGYVMSQNALLEEIKSGANPEIANLHKKRFAVSSEPSAKKQIMCSTMKTLTSNGSVNCRGLYSSITETIIACLLVMEANELPKFDEVNDAIMRRLMVIYFESMFVSDDLWSNYTKGMSEEEIKEANIYHANLYYKSDAFKQENRQAFVEILFEYFQKFREAQYKLPEIAECKQASTDYMAMSDDLSNWFMEECEEDKESYIDVKDLYQKFITTDYYQNMTKQEKRTNNQMKFKDKLKTNLFVGRNYKDADKYFNGKCIRHAFIAGYRIKEKRRERENMFQDDNTDVESTSTEN